MATPVTLKSHTGKLLGPRDEKGTECQRDEAAFETLFVMFPLDCGLICLKHLAS